MKTFLTNKLIVVILIIVVAVSIVTIKYFSASGPNHSTVTTNNIDSVAEYVATKLDECGSNDQNGMSMPSMSMSNMDCFNAISKDVLEKFELKDLMSALEKNTDNSRVISDCHIFTHAAGKAAYEKYQDFPKTVLQCTQFCSYGCYHAVAEAYFTSKYKTVEAAKKSFILQLPEVDIAKVCSSLPAGDKETSCKVNLYHGLGHAFMALTNNNLKQSLRLCDVAIKKGSDDIGSVPCYFGVFMINSDLHHANDPLSPCDTLDKKYQEACYQDKSGAMFTENIPKNIAMCKLYPAEFQDYCFSRVAKNHSTTLRDINLFKKDCDFLEAKYRNACVGDILKDLTSRFPEDYKLVIDYCHLLEFDNKKSCYSKIYEQMDWLRNETNARIACLYVQDDLKDVTWCKKGGGDTQLPQ